MVATGGPYQLSEWSIDGDRIAGRLHATEMETSGIVSNEAPAQIHLGLFGILVLIETFRRRMRNINLGPSNGAALPIGDFADEAPATASAPMYPAGAQRLIFTPERSGRRCRC
jgi:hypothetical protein